MWQTRLSLRKLWSQKHIFTSSKVCQSTAQANPIEKAVEVEEPRRTHIKSAIKRGRPKIPKRQPLVKNFMVGVVDKDLLAFPEVIPRDEYKELKKDYWAIENYFKDTFDSTISSESLNAIKNLGLFGLNIPQINGGGGLFMSESLWVSQHENVSTSLGALLSVHRSISDTISQYGTDLQKEKYLSKLASGSITAAAAIYELEPTNDDIFNTKIVYDPEEDVWFMNGEKSFVLNGPSADVFLVIAQSNPMSLDHEQLETCSTVLVDSNTPGVSIGQVQNSIGELGFESCKVSFKNVRLNDLNVIGGKALNHKVGETFIKSSRMRSSLVALELSKKIVNHITNYSIVTKQYRSYLKDLNNIKDKISGLVANVYAMESMIYYTAGLIDEFDEQDVILETAITKYFTSQMLFKISCAALEFLGPKVLMKGERTEEFFRNASELYTHGESIESLKMFIALCGIQHAGTIICEDIFRSRNPVFHPLHMFKKFLSSNIENIKTNMHLHEHVHPSLHAPAECIELSVGRLKLCAEMLLNRYGNEIVDKQVEIARLTEIITTCYAMYASTSRASRSYCIGLRFADNEFLATHAICLDGKKRVHILAAEVMDGPYLTNENNLQRMSKEIFNSKGYFFTHPLTYNF